MVTQGSNNKAVSSKVLQCIWYRFNLNLENFGVNTIELKTLAPKHTFHVWIKEWEEDLLKKNDVVAEEWLLEKYKDLTLYDPANKCIYTVWHKHFEWQCRHNVGWCLISCPMDDKLEDEPFPGSQIVIDLIAEPDQNSNADIILDDKVASVWVMSLWGFGVCLEVCFFAGRFNCNCILICMKWGCRFQSYW